MPKAFQLSIALLFLAAGQAGGQSFQNYQEDFPESVKAFYHVPVEMRDGVRLMTDVYLPEEGGQFPTLLVRDMYSNGSTDLRLRYAKFATVNGYAFVFQTVRGRYDSDGRWYPYFQEINDGDDTLTWIAEQPWSDGKVGMFGSSYLASVQWLAALNGNPALVAIAPAVSPGNYYRDVAYPGGAFSLLSRARWGIAQAGSRTNMNYPIDWINGIGHLPLETLAENIGFDVRHFQDWLAHPTYDAYWRPLNLEARAPEMSVPALNIGGWYDVFLRSTIGSYQTMTREAATETARQGQRMILGPWPHGWNQSSTVGDLDFGADALIGVEDILLEWFDHWLKDGPAPEGKPIQIFVMGENVWREEDQWPLANTMYTDYFLHEDGSLSPTTSAETAGELQYTYDPADPTPTLGGNIMEPTLRGPHDQRPLDERQDILRFLTEPFAEETEITGPLSAEIYASSSAVDTDFMVKLVVVKPDGFAFNLVDGVIRARYREGFEQEQLLQPDAVYQYVIDMWATSYLLEPGDRLRLDVTSSNYPRLARNLNTGAPFARTTEMQVARQTIHMSEQHPSRLILPVIPRSNSGRPVEGASFTGTPLYRNEVAADILLKLEARMEPLEAGGSLSEDDYIELGALYIAANRFRDAIDLYTRGIEEHPESFKLRRHRGHRYINVRELENAIADLREAVRLIGTEHAGVLEYGADGAPTGTYEHWTWYHIGLYHYLHGNWEQAAAAYRTCVETATTNQSRVGSSDWLYNALRKNGMHEEAEAVIAAVPADIDTNREHPYFKRVMIYKGELSPADVVDIGKPASEWTGFDVTAGYGIANWLAFEGDPDTANTILQKIIQTPFWNSWAYVVTDRELATR